MLILIAGPVRTGTGDHPELIQKNLEKLEAFAIPIFERGHIPIIGEWVAMPLMKIEGLKYPGDAIWEKFQYPVAHRLIEKCDAVFRIIGESKGADHDVQIALGRGIPVYYNINEIPYVN